MSTSGSTDFSLSRNDIIMAAALETGDVALGEPMGADTTTAYALRLNTWVKMLMVGGARMWAMKQATLFLSPGVARYELGATGAHCANDYVRTTLSANAAGAAVSLGLAAFTGMASGDNLGVILDDGSIHWTGISGAPGASTTIAAALPSAASAGATVFTYTNKITRPQRIDSDAAYWRSPAGQDTPVTMISRAEYAQLTNKSARGKITQAFYDAQLVNGVLSVWPTPDSAGDVLSFAYERILEDFDNFDDTPDFAVEWGEALILGLASKMAPTAGLSLNERQDLERRAAAALAVCMGYDRENVSTFFQPDVR